METPPPENWDGATWHICFQESDGHSGKNGSPFICAYAYVMCLFDRLMLALTYCTF